MGRCQGRYCMPVLAEMLDRPQTEADFPAPQMPLRPIPLSALAVEKISDSYINLVAIRTADKAKPWVKDLEAAYRSRAFLDATNKYLAGYEKTDYQLALEKTLKK